MATRRKARLVAVFLLAMPWLMYLFFNLPVWGRWALLAVCGGLAAILVLRWVVRKIPGSKRGIASAILVWLIIAGLLGFFVVFPTIAFVWCVVDNIKHPKPVVVPAAEKERQEVRKALTQLAREQPNEVFGRKFSQPAGFLFTDFWVHDSHVWAVGYRTDALGHGCIIHSQDKGKTWKVQWENDKTKPFKVHFFDQTQGLVATENQILATKDGGATWDVLLSVKNLPGTGMKIIQNLWVESPVHLRVYLKLDVSGFLETMNGGEIWEYHNSRRAKIPPVRTVDKGATWKNL